MNSFWWIKYGWLFDFASLLSNLWTVCLLNYDFFGRCSLCDVSPTRAFGPAETQSAPERTCRSGGHLTSGFLDCISRPWSLVAGLDVFRFFLVAGFGKNLAVMPLFRAWCLKLKVLDKAASSANVLVWPDPQSGLASFLDGWLADWELGWLLKSSTPCTCGTVTWDMCLADPKIWSTITRKWIRPWSGATPKQSTNERFLVGKPFFREHDGPKHIWRLTAPRVLRAAYDGRKSVWRRKEAKLFQRKAWPLDALVDVWVLKPRWGFWYSE